MPIIKINIFAGKTNEEKKGICDHIQTALKQSFKINHDNFHYRIFEFKESEMIIPAGKSKNYILIELELFPGKTKEQKNEMYKLIEKKLKLLNIDKDDIIIIFREPQLENWYIRGETAEEIVNRRKKV